MRDRAPAAAPCAAVLPQVGLYAVGIETTEWIANPTVATARMDRADNRRDNRREVGDSRRENREDVRKERREWHEDRWRRHRARHITRAAFRSLSCRRTTIIVNGITYHSCGGNYYERVYQGGTVVYVIVSAPPGY